MPSTPGTLNFPASGIEDAISLIELKNRASGSLAADISAVATSLTLASESDASEFPSTGVITVDDERFFYSSRSGTTFSGLTRGVDNSTAATHSTAAEVRQNYIARCHAVVVEAIIATQTKIGWGSATPTVGKFLVGNTTAGTSTWRVLAASDIPDISATYQVVDSDLTAISALSTTGIITRTGSGTYSTRTITATSNLGCVIVNGDMVAGNSGVGLDLNNLTEDSSAASGDYFAFYKASAPGTRKITRANLLTSLGALTALTVREVDGAPSVSASILEFQQAVGFVVTDQTGGVARVTLSSIPDSTLATISTAGKVADSALSSNVTLGGNAFTGSGSIVRATSPALVTPALGVATATSINGLTITTSAGTLTISNGKTVSFSNTLTFTGTDGSSVALGAGGTVAYTSNKLSVFAATTSSELAGVISDETGSGALVFATSPTLVTPTLGAASATSLSVTGTGGAGYLQLANQSSNPGTPTSASRIFIDSSNRLSWIGTNGFVRTFDGTANSADRVYTLPDAAGTVGLANSTTGTIPYLSATGVFSDSPVTRVNSTTIQVAAINGGSAANDDITIQGTSSSTRTTSYVILQPTAGLVGIRTTSPVAYLDLRGSDAAVQVGDSSSAILASTQCGFAAVKGTQQFVFGLQDSVAFGFTGMRSNHDFILTTNDAERIRIKTDGKVGIGESSPGSKLAVSGNCSIGASYDTTAAPTNGLICEGKAGFGTSSPNATAIVHVYQSSGDVPLYVESITGQYSYLHLASASSAWDLAVKDNQFSGAFQFRYNGASPNVIVSTGGNVGIGTTSFGSSAAKVLALGNGTTPGALADVCHLWALDFAAGDSRLRILSESGSRITIGNDYLAMATGSTEDTFLGRAGAANWKYGAVDDGSPVAQTISTQSATGTNAAGAAAFKLIGSMGTGTGVPGRISLQTGALSPTSGSTAHTAVDRLIVGASKVVANNTTTTLVNVTVASNTVASGIIQYAVEVFDGVDIQTEEGQVSFHVSNKGGTIANNVTTKYGNQQLATSGTLAVTWTITAANPALVQINANSSLTPSSGYPRVVYTVINTGNQAVAVQ